MTRTLFLLFTLFFFAHMAVGQDVTPDATRQAAWDAFEEQEGPTWRVRWHERTGLPRSLVGGLTHPYTGGPEAAARTFLTDYRTLFGMKTDLADLKHVQTRVNRVGVRHVTFQQYYEGLRVEGAQYKVHLRKDGRVDMANGFYYPSIAVSTTSTVTEAQAIRIAEADLDAPGAPDFQVTSELVIYPGEKAFHLA